MIEKILKIIDDFFDFSYLISFNKKKRKKVKINKFTPEEKQKFEELIEQSKILEYIENYQKIPMASLLFPIMNLFSNLLKDPSFKKENIDNLRNNAKTEDLIPKKKKHIDNFLHSFLSPIFSNFSEDYIGIFTFLEEYANLVKEDLDINTIYNSLSYMIEERSRIRDLFYNKPMSELIKYRKWIYFEKIQKSTPGDFKIYFNDWTLKNSQLIESHIKKILRLVLKFQMLINGTNIKDIEKIIDEFKTIGKILYYLDPKRKYKNLDRIRIYRNATFHSEVNFICDNDSNKKLIIFKDENEKKVKISIWKFLQDFQKLVIFILTMNYIIGHILFKHEHNGKSIYQINLEYTNQHGIERLIDKLIKIRMGDESWWLIGILP